MKFADEIPGFIINAASLRDGGIIIINDKFDVYVFNPKNKQIKKVIYMPYASDAQRRWAHTKKGTKALGGKKKVAEWDKASKGKKLPEHVKKRKSK